VTSDPRIRFVIALMERHRAAPLSIAELARAVNLSPAHLTLLFRREVGQSPARVWRELRLDHARELLQTSFLTVKQVMAASGWNDPSHFCREFKRRRPKPAGVSRPRRLARRDWRQTAVTHRLSTRIRL
jgi:transcriptional regulator GlxA family with amidase domain